MKVYELIEKLNKYNQNADINVVVNGFSKEFEIYFGGSEGCQPYNCDCVDLMVDTLCEEERDERMTDDEIIKALACCGIMHDCNECYLCDFRELGTGNCVNLILTKAYELINRQQAEIERLAARFNEYPVKVMTGDNAEIYAKSTADYEKLIEDISNIGGEKAGERIMTQYERIKNMSIDDMANFIHELITICNTTECEDCKYCDTSICMSCYEAKDWLESEVRNEKL